MKALIFGASGQDGPYLANYLASLGYEVWGCIPAWDPNRLRTEQRAPDMKLVFGDLLDPQMPMRVIGAIEPDEIYNLAALTFVPDSWGQADLVAQTNGLPLVRMLEAVKVYDRVTRVYQASTSEMFGSSPPPQSERTPMMPVSPYACAKLFAHAICRVYRESYGMFVVSGILFNHESPWRGEEFVTRVVTTGVARILAGKQEKLQLGNLEAVRDWGHAYDYVRAMHLMLTAPEPRDYVIGTGRSATVKEMAEMVLTSAKLDPTLIESVPQAKRLVETAPLTADAHLAATDLGWQPKTSLPALLDEMLLADKMRLAGEWDDGDAQWYRR